MMLKGMLLGKEGKERKREEYRYKESVMNNE